MRRLRDPSVLHMRWKRMVQISHGPGILWSKYPMDVYDVHGGAYTSREENRRHQQEGPPKDEVHVGEAPTQEDDSKTRLGDSAGQSPCATGRHLSGPERHGPCVRNRSGNGGGVASWLDDNVWSAVCYVCGQKQQA